MPTYEYRCKDCGNELEVVQSFSDDALTTCEACGGALRKLFGNVGIAFKGSGFYKNDSRGSGSKSSGTATAEGGSSDNAASSGTASTSDSSTSTSSDTSSSDKASTPDKGKKADKAAASTSG